MNNQALVRAIFGEKLEQEPSTQVIEEVLSTLSPRERIVLYLRFGDHPKTLEAIGHILPRRNGKIGITKQVVHQIEAKALRKLRHPSRSRKLRGLVL